MKTPFRDFSSKPLFILEMANNHMGDVEHGLRILREFREVTKEFDFDFAFKLQHRDDSFFHPDFKDRKDIKHVKRFTETKLGREDFNRLREEMTNLGYISMNTPWDEKSVDLMEDLGFDVIKVASCSFLDWPLLERIVKSSRPIVASTAGVEIEDIDKVVAFFQHRRKIFGIMQCVAAYPCANSQLQLNQIDLLKKRYPGVPIGFSTHEDPANFDVVGLAIAKGARLFEKHVGVPTDKYPLNTYSATPAQVKQWLTRAREAYELCGANADEGRMKFSAQEMNDLQPLYRGAFASRDVAAGEKLTAANVFFAMPNVGAKQLAAKDFSKYAEFIAKTALKKNSPVLDADVETHKLRGEVETIIARLKAALKTAGVFLPNQVEMEISCHYGLDRFSEWGAVLMKVVNREYCKMLLVMFPGQKYPAHAHKIKEETLHILHGDLEIDIKGQKRALKAGDVITVERGVEHSFTTKEGVVIEEISTTYYQGDSYYRDAAIAKNASRKIELTYWIN